MRHRNPLFVAGFPYSLIVVGYLTLITVSGRTNQDATNLSSSQIFSLIGASILLLIGCIYVVYWAASTSKELRTKFEAKIPSTILVVIPIANIWWQWKYSHAASKATANKLDPIIAFVALFLLGCIGMGIIQHFYNQNFDYAKHVHKEKPHGKS